MITKENLNEVVNLLSDKDKKRVLNSDKEFTVLSIGIFNVGSVVTAKLTNDYTRYQSILNNGGAALYTSEVVEILNGEN